jgi:D-alanine-D-alanine ligase
MSTSFGRITRDSNTTNAPSLYGRPVAVLHQAVTPPSLSGAVKPSNPFGYRDSSADIASALTQAGCEVLTPVRNPRPDVDADWTYPDTLDGITQAVSDGAEILWANTSLFDEHPMADFGSRDGLYVVGQPLDVVEKFEDKKVCQAAISAIGVPVPVQALVNVETGPAKGQVEAAVSTKKLTFPIIVKPVRGRGSAGVKVVDSVAEAAEHIESLVGPKFGSKFLLEEYLSGRELAVTVMPPGTYETADGVCSEATHWPLPAIERTGHHGGVMPFSGVVPIQSNSKPAGDDDQLREFGRHAVRVAQFLKATAPIRIDCREDANGVIKAIDINMKPSMTGPGRPGRQQMINLSAMAAEVIGWSYTEMLAAIAVNAAPIRRITRPAPRRGRRSLGQAPFAASSARPRRSFNPSERSTSSR